jgi:hypothetical protein
MKNFILIPILFVYTLVISQSNTKQTLSANKTSALINSNGVLFENDSLRIPAYEIPKGSGLATFYAASIWIGGIDENDSLRLAASRYGDSGKDFYPGPYSELPNFNQNLNYLNQWQKQIWKVSKSQIACHKSNYMNPNYTIPQDILSWPAHGDTSLGISANLAPFVDLDSNNIYNPENGEYPLIKGDEAVFYIMNDIAGSHTQSQGLPLGLEVHVMAYQFKETNSYLDSTTFVNYKIINKGIHTYDSLKIAFFADADIGFYGDDYYGCDVTRNMIYFYNGDYIDETDGGRLGYGVNPPAVGILSLNHLMNYSCYFSAPSVYPYTDPQIAAQYYNYISGKWANGSSFLYGTTNTPTNHMFPGQSDQSGTLSTNGIDMSSSFPNGWSEITNNNYPGDRRGYLSSEPLALQPSQEICLDYAVLYARSTTGTIMGSVDRLGLVADSCKQFYNNNLQLSSCLNSIVYDNTIFPSNSSCCSNFSPPIITTTPSDSSICNGTGNVILDTLGNFTVEWSNGSQGVNATNLCPGSVLVVATDNTFGCVFNQYGFVNQVGSTYPLSLQLSVQDASHDGLCDGSAQIFAYGGVTPYNYELYDINNTLVSISSTAESLCSGIYKIIVKDAVLNIDSISFYVAQPSNFYSNIIISIDSTILDTLVTNVIEECTINFATVDSAWISAVNYINTDTAMVIWGLRDLNGIHFVNKSYVITNFIGNYIIELSLFCPAKSQVDPYLKILSNIYVDAYFSTSSLEQLKAGNPIKLYPNPTKDIIFIDKLELNFESIRMFDTNGKDLIIDIDDIGDKIRITLPKEIGVYYLEFKTSEKNYINRVIKLPR